jgi:DNA segregation ATPase FtsK/SpoIIIE, S-DNA-T family
VTVRLTLPVFPQVKDRPPFPLIATVAPLGVGVVLVVVTGSLMSLAFAILGPIIAVGTLVDGRRSRRRDLRRSRERFHQELERTRDLIAAAQAEERAGLEARYPAATNDPVWDDPAQPAVRIGHGSVPSALEVEHPTDNNADSEFSETVRALIDVASTVPDAPVVVDSSRVLTVVGSPTLARPLFRSIAVQLAARLSPATHTVVASEQAESWIGDLPHAPSVRASSPHGADRSANEAAATSRPVLDFVEFRSAAGEHVGVRLSAESVGIAGTIVRVTPRGARLDSVGAIPVSVATVVETMTAEEARAWAQRSRAMATRLGIRADGADLPETVAFESLEQVEPALAATLGCGASGPIVLDLVAHGPHAVIGGTTGSGKSELLVTWLLGMAARRPPSAVAFLLFDFKGGSSFGAVPRIPHCVGLVTDLDARAAKRALESLGAELRYRERTLAEAGARSIDDLDGGSLPRLVVVVDEFASVAETFPELYAVFADVAARGRSLGVHLVLCTQRPAGIVRDAVMANIGLRISLRVTNAADSIAVLGSDAAARLVGQPLGRACVAQAGQPVTTVQVALASDADVEGVGARWATHASARRPWRDPLPAVVEPETVFEMAREAGRGLASSSKPFGLIDLPAEQAQPAAFWDPVHEGSLVVVGGTASGKTGALAAATLNRSSCWVPADVEGAWDALSSPPEDTLIVVDDLDLLLARFGVDYEREVVERLIGIARDPRRRLAMSTQRLVAGAHLVAQECESRLLLRVQSRQEHVIAGGSGIDFDNDVQHGGGLWRGHRIQVAAVQPPTRSTPAKSPQLAVAGLVIAVSSRPAQVREHARAAGHRVVELASLSDDDRGPALVVADPEGWQSAYPTLTRLRAACPLVFHGCSLADFRAISRLRELPPPLADPATSLWLVDAGIVSRVRLDAS